MFWYFAKWLYECIIQVLKRLKDSISAFSIYWDAFWYFSRRCNNICIAIFALQHLLQVVATDLKWTLFFKLFGIIHTTRKQMLLNSFHTNFSNNNFQFVSNTSFFMRTRGRRKPLSHYLWGKNIAHKITTYFGNKICCPRTHQSSMNPAKWIKICILLYLWSVNWIIKCEWQTIINTFRQFSYYPLCRIKYVKNIIKFLSIY